MSGFHILDRIEIYTCVSYRHQKRVIGDFELRKYSTVQQAIYRAAEAIQIELQHERVYIR